MKKVIALLLALVMVVGMAACGGQSEGDTIPQQLAANDSGSAGGDAAAPEKKDDGSADTGEDKEPVTLSFWYFAETGVDPIWEAFAEQVHETYPWITLELEVLPGDTGPEKFTVACATGTTPDIYCDGYSRIAPAITAGLTVDLTDVVEANQDLFFGEQTEGVVDGRNYYVATHSGAPYCLLINMDLAEDLGVADMIPEDRETWTYEQFLDTCRAAKAADPSVYPVALYGGSRSGDAWDYSWFLGNGAEILNEDHTATVINEGANKEKIVEVLKLYQTLIDEGLVPDGVASMIDEDVDSLYFSGRLLFEPTAYNYLSWTNTLQEEGTAVQFRQDAVCLPTPDGREPPMTTSWGSYGYCVFGNDGHEEDAKLVIDLLLKDTATRTKLIQVSGKLPIMSDVEVSYETPEITAIMERAVAYGAQYANSTFGILEPFWSDFRETFYVQKQDLFVGNITPEQFVKNWAAAGDAVISDYLAANG